MVPFKNEAAVIKLKSPRHLRGGDPLKYGMCYSMFK